ncbi:MAG: HAD family hydrolase [Clostridia bacterium]|nr:HAD family hydrolase [Clostridia bacterium]
MNKAVIFDLDGTLLDTIDDITDSINGMLNEFGYKAIDREQVRQIIGSGAKKLIADALPEKLSDEEFIKRLETYNRIYNASGSPKTKLFGGIKEVVTELKNRGYKLAVLSNKPQHSTDKVAEKYLSGLGFDFIGGQSEKIKCKPDPAGALYVLQELGVKPENAYLVGDGETDVLAAINAGIAGVCALWGNRTKAQLLAAGGTLFAETPSDILKIIL